MTDIKALIERLREWHKNGLASLDLALEAADALEAMEQSLRIHKGEYAKRCDEIEQLEAKFEAARGGWADHISDGIDDDAALKIVDGWIEERIAGEKAKEEKGEKEKSL